MVRDSDRELEEYYFPRLNFGGSWRNIVFLSNFSEVWVQKDLLVFQNGSLRKSVEVLSLSDNTSKSRVLAAKLISKRVRQAASKLRSYAPQPEVFYARTDVGPPHIHQKPLWNPTSPKYIQTKLTILINFSSHFILLKPFEGIFGEWQYKNYILFHLFI